MERKAWLPVSAALTVIGGVIVALAGNQIGLSVVGSVILFFGFNLWVPIAYSWTTENFPTRARTTGFLRLSLQQYQSKVEFGFVLPKMCLETLAR